MKSNPKQYKVVGGKLLERKVKVPVKVKAEQEKAVWMNDTTLASDPLRMLMIHLICPH